MTAATGDIIISDSFSGTSGVTLPTYNPSWVTKPGDGAAYISNAGRVRAGSTGASYHSAEPATAEYDVRADFRVFSSDVAHTESALAGRADPTISDEYNVIWSDNSGESPTLWLYRISGGSANLLGSTTTGVAIGVGNTARIECRIRTASKVAVYNGVEKISSSDNVVTAKGQAGFYMIGTGSNTAGTHLDNFEVQDTVSVRSEAPAQAIWMG